MIACAFACFAETSSNVVGFNELNLAKGYNYLVLNFYEVGAKREEVPVNELFDLTTGWFKCGTSHSSSDMLMLYDNKTKKYVKWFAFYKKPAKNKASDYRNYTWVDYKTKLPVSKTLKTGQPFFFIRRSKGTIGFRISGEISKKEYVDVNVLKGKNFIGNAFPITWDPNSFGTKYWKYMVEREGAVAGESSSKADYLMIYLSSSKYEKFYLYKAKAGTKASKRKAADYTWLKSNNKKSILTLTLAPDAGTTTGEKDSSLSSRTLNEMNVHIK